MEIAKLNELIETKRNAWSNLYDARKWRADHDDVEIKAHQAYFTITSTSNSDWVPQDIQDKISEVKEYFKTCFNNLDDKIESLESDYNRIVEEEKTACKDYKHCFIINITLYKWGVTTENYNKDYCIWFEAKNKKAYKKELNEAVDSLKNKIEELKSSDKIDSYYLRSYSIESYESIKTFKTAKLTVDNMLSILDDIKNNK